MKEKNWRAPSRSTKMQVDIANAASVVGIGCVGHYDLALFEMVNSL